MKFATKPYNITHLTLGMLLHYLGKLKIQIFCRRGRKCKQIAFLKIASNFVIHPLILIISMFKIASLLPYWLQIKFSMWLFFYLFTFAINLWHRKFVTADITAVFVNNQRGIQQQGQDFDKKSLYLKEYIAKWLTDEFPEKSWTKHGPVAAPNSLDLNPVDYHVWSLMQERLNLQDRSL